MENLKYLDAEFKAQWLHAMEQAKLDRPRYLNWIKDEINNVITLIDKYDKIYLLGGLGSRLLKSSPNFYNQYMASYSGPDIERAKEELIIEDDEIEVLLEYAMNIASAKPNINSGILPSIEDIDEVRNQLSKIISNISFYEMSADYKKNSSESDHQLKINVMIDNLRVRGAGYHSHIVEIFQETFTPHDGFLQQYYGFNSNDILEVKNRLDLLVASKIGNAFGSSFAHKRFIKWNDEKGDDEIQREMVETGKHFIQQFTQDNPDLFDEEIPESIGLIHLDNIKVYNRLFWVIPKTDKEKKIFENLAHRFGDNKAFLEGHFSGFPLGDTIIQNKPLILIDNKYYCFSTSLPFRNIFNITSNLIQAADKIYFEHSFKGNSNINSRDNFIERKTKSLFEKLIPSGKFFHSLKYSVVEDGKLKETELDVLGIGNKVLYIIEVKAGELNKKHRRGAVLGLKDRIKETIGEGSYQCSRAEKFILENNSPEFSYIENGKKEILLLKPYKQYQIVKISVTFEHFSSISVNLKYLINSGVLSADYKWAWIVSLYDLMIFADLIEKEEDFLEYINYRLDLYDRDDIEFNDEIDILGYFFEGKFPLPSENKNEKIFITSSKEEIEDYYTKKDLGMPNIVKPVRKKG